MFKEVTVLNDCLSPRTHTARYSWLTAFLLLSFGTRFLLLMEKTKREDLVWDTAWEWVVREHEHPLSASVRQQMVAWLNQDPSHLKAYEEAAHIWLLAGLILPTDESSDDCTS